MDAVDGFNSKINAVAIQSLDDVQLPAVIGSVPADGATNVSLSSSISANFLHFPNLDNTGATGINNNTITTANVKLYKVVGNTVTQVTISVNGTGGGDAINISLPSSTLDANTRYRYTIEGVEDITGAELFPFSAEFVTGSSIGGTGGGNLDNVSFTNSGTVANGNYHTLTIGPDGKLYGLTSLGEIHRWIMNVDGSLSNKEILTGFNDSQGLQICIGLEFALNATANNLVAYVTHSSLPDGEGEAFGGGLTRLSGSNLQNGQQILTNLPRSIKDHFPLSITTDPVDPNILYFNQGSNSAAGEPDGGWGFRPERLLTAATLKLDLSKLPNNLPLDVKTSVNQSVINSATTNSATMSDGSYNPYFVNAPLTLFATGLRNAYDLVWHSNGQLYVPTNGTAGNSNAPASVNGTRRPDGSFYNGPTIPALFGNQVQRDFLYRIDPDLPTGYYGHPNPTRGEFVLNRGPVDESDYPSSVQVDANYRGIAFDFEFNKSPNGVIEYKTAGDLQGAMIVCRYSGGSDLIALLPDGPNGDVSTSKIGIPGFAGLNNPLDIIEDTNTGNLYVTDLGESAILLLKPSNGVAPSAFNVSFITPFNNSSIAVGGSLDVEVLASSNTGSISNVQLFLNNELVRQENGAPYEWGLASQRDDILENLAEGTYTLKAVATDSGGNKAESSITVNVGQSTSGLNISFSSPEDGDVYAIGQDLNIEIFTSNNALVSNIDLFLNNQLVRRERGAPYEWGLDSQPDDILENLAVGTYVLKAVATDTGGNIVETSITITVGQGNSGLNLSFAAPLNGADLAVGTDLDVEILTNDNSLVSSIDLFLNNQLVRRERGAPYEWGLDSQPDAILENLSAGTYELRAVATQTGGNIVEESITVTVGQGTSGLNLTFAAPLNGTDLAVGTDLDVEILTNNNSLVSSIDLFLNNQLVRRERGAPYEWGLDSQPDAILENLSAGTYELRAVATQTGGNIVEESITVTVGQGTSGLNLTFAAPLNGTDLAVGTDLDVEILTNDNSLVSSIDLFLNNQLVRRESGAPYEWGLDSQPDAILENLSAGTYELRAVATQTGGNIVEESITVTVGQGTSGLNLTFAAPLNGTDLAVGTDLDVEILTNDNSLVSSIDLFLNNQLVRRERGAPYEWGLDSQPDAILENLSAGTYELRAVATTTGGNTVEESITITVGQSASALSIWFAAPINGANLPVGTDLDIAILTTDDNLVSKIELYLNDEFVRQELHVLYGWGGPTQGDAILENLSAGTYVLKAIATDTGGKTIETSITITVGQSTSALNLSFAAPLNGADLAVGTDLDVEVLTNNNSLVATIDLFLNNQLVRREGGAPYEWGLASQTDAILENLSAGTYVLKAIATDTGGNTVETSITITVGQSTSDLNISFAAPLNRADLAVGTDLEVEILTNDNSLVATIDLFLNNQLVRRERGAPYEWGLTSQTDAILENLSAGTYVLKAIATDTGGNTRESTITITVGQSTSALNLSFATPLNGADLAAGTDLDVEVLTNDNSLVSNIDLFLNNQLVRRERGAPYEWGLASQNDDILENLSAGTYTLKAVATDKVGNTVEESITITIGQSTSALNLSFATPLNGADLAVGTDLEVVILTNDNSLVSNIDLFLNNQLVRRERGAPYEWGLASQSDAILENLAAGTYVLKAVATDKVGNTVEESITITVGQIPSGLNISFAEPLNSAQLVEGTDLYVEILTNDNSLVSNIRLFLNNEFVRQEGGAPYEWGLDSQPDDILENLGAGVYVLKAVATDTDGNTVETSITVTVQGEAVVLTEFPEDLQFYARDVQTNKSTIAIEGQLNTAGSSIRVVVLRNGQFYNQEEVTPSGLGFSLTTQIDAELAKYTVQLYVVSASGQAVLHQKAENVVAGDVYIITGQSNAEARNFLGSAAENNSDYIRVFGYGGDDVNTLNNNLKWFIGQGDGDSYSLGNTGQWGLHLAKQIIDSQNVPVCIFNGAKGGRSISHFAKDDATPENIETNYGRLLYRLRQTKLADKVRAIFWYQGASDASNGTALSTYKQAFTTLQNNWLVDYPTIEHTYITQIKDGCGQTQLRNVIIQEAHRQLGQERPATTTMSTKGMLHEDGCHFAYEDGYKELGRRYFRLVSRDLYGESVVAAASPDVEAIYFTTNDEIIIQSKDGGNLTWENGAEIYFQLEGSNATIVSGSTDGDKVILQLSGDGSDATGLTYLDENDVISPYVISQDGHGLLSFYNFPIIKSGNISVRNLRLIPGTERGFPYDDRVIFHRFLGRDENSFNLTSMFGSIEIANNGSGVLTVNDVTINSADFEIVSGGGSFQLAANETREVLIEFVKNSGVLNELYEAQLRVNSNDSSNPVTSITLAGHYSGSTAVPNVHEISAVNMMDLFGFDTKVVADGELLVSDYPTAEEVASGSYGDIVVSKLWEQADPSQPISVLFTNVLQGPGTSRITLTNEQGGVVDDFSIRSSAQWVQGLFPSTASSPLELATAGKSGYATAPFYLNINGSTTLGSQGTQANGDPVTLPLRLFKIFEADGTLRPNEYYAMMDYIPSGGCVQNAGSCDFNDNGFYITNIKPIDESRIASIVANVGDGEQVSQDINTSSTATNTTCGEVAITYGVGTITFEGIANKDYFFKINDLNDNWATVGGCSWNCGNQLTVNDLANSNYLLTVYNADWSIHCDTEIQMTGSNIIAPSASDRTTSQLTFAAYQAHRAVDLQWLSNSGYKVNTFEVEHSLDGENFSQIGQLTNKKWSNELEYHQTIDEQPKKGVNYYRVKENYLNGSFAYTPVQSVVFGIDLAGISIFPNPAREALFINLGLQDGLQADLTMTNHLGQEVKALKVESMDNQLIQLNTADLLNGLYYLNISVEGQKSFTKKVLINHLY